MNKTITAVVIVIILALGGWAIFGRGNKSNNSIYGSNNTSSSPASNQSNNSGTQNQAAGSVSIRNMMFTPSQITVAKGSKVTWTNNDSVTHTVVDDLSNVGGPNSGDIAPGATYSFTFNKAGSYQYHCSIHPSMRGTIVVK